MVGPLLTLGASVTWERRDRAGLGGAAGVSPLSAASLHPFSPWVCPTPSVPSGALSPLLTLLQSRETLNKAICICQYSLPASAGEGSLGLGTTEERRQACLGAMERNQVGCVIVSLSAQEAGAGGLDF